MRITNLHDTPISLAVWLAHDPYDHDHDPMSISATALMRPVRQLVLSSRTTDENSLLPDVQSRVGSAVGSAIHAAIEDVWKDDDKRNAAFQKLGYPSKIAKRILINPKPEDIKPDSIPVYMEIRSHKVVGEYTVSGKFDFIIEGILRDFKKTKVYKFKKGTSDEDYSIQGSIYRWLNPTIITESSMRIDYIFTDWSAAKVGAEENYPPNEAMQKRIPLMSLEETDIFVKNKIKLITKMYKADERDLPYCNQKNLWQDDPIFKYYAIPANAEKKGGRSTKNFTNEYEANQRAANDGKGGVVVAVPGLAKACKYCSGFDLCKQKDELIASGMLKL
jgi:hypothetical protein